MALSSGRRRFIGALASALTTLLVSRRAPATERKERRTVTTPRQPVLFLGHGSPMNAIEDNEWSRAFARLGRALPAPKAILAISAHWFVPGIHTTGNAKPETIHDFGGFPDALFAMQYPAPGDARLAQPLFPTNRRNPNSSFPCSA